MRPHDPSVRSKASALARARMHLTAGLGWIRGYPTGVRQGRVQWVSVPAPGTGRPVERRTVSREELRSASLTHRKLLARHRGSLERIVGDLPAWSAGVERRLEALKQCLNHGGRLAGAEAMLGDASPADRRAAKRAAAADARLAPLITALAWIHCGDPREAGTVMRFVESHAGGLAELIARPAPGAAAADGFGGAVGLCDLLAADGRGLAAAPARVLCDPRAFRVPHATPYRISDAVQAMFRKQRRRPALQWPARPAPELGNAMLEALPGLARLAEGPRRRALRLLALLTPRAATTRWEQWWASAERTMAAVERRVAPAMPEMGRIRDLRRHHAALRRLERQAPPPVPMSRVCARVLELCGAGGDDRAEERFLRDCARGLRELPELQGRYALRIAFFLHWMALWRQYPSGVPVLRRCMGLTRGLLRAGVFPERIVLAWGHIADRREGSAWDLDRAPEGQLLDGSLPAAAAPKLYRLLELLAWGAGAEGPLPLYEHVRWTIVPPLLAACGDARSAAAFLRAVAGAELEERVSQMAPRLVAALVACAQTDPERFAALCGLFADVYAESLDDLPALVTATGQAELIGDWLLAGESKRVLAFAARHALVRALGAGRRLRLAGPRPRKTTRATSRTAKWMQRYPDRLRPVLRELSTVSDEAEQQAGRVLGAAYPDPRALAAEIAGLEKRMSLAVPDQAAAMRKRLASLRQRLGAPAKVSPARLRKLEAKLEARVRDLTLTAWEAEADRVAVPALAAKLGRDLPPGWVDDPRRVRLLAELAALDAPFATLGFTLVGVRLGDPPWDLRDHPANRRWRRAMEQRGLRLGPWVDGPGAQEVAGPGGRGVTLALENDPLEVFRMGEPFGTCLSPGDFNFFSTVANAADLNKRVLFARDAAGKIEGRCLFAISTDGRLLTFHAYAHDGAWPFAKVVRRYAGRLAKAIGTELAPVGEVAKLVASDWYDDGPVDMTGRFRWTRETSPFAKALPRLAPEELAGWIDRITAGRGLDTLTAPLLLGMQPLRDRPDLVAALLPALAEVPGVSPEQLLDAVYLVVHAESERAAANPPGTRPRWLRPLVRRLVAHSFWRRDLNYWDEERLLLACLVTDLPSEVLLLLRRTRPRGVRSWDAEYADSRIYAAACAHDALHRPAVALRLFERVAEASYTSISSKSQDHARRRVAELKAQLGR